MMTWTMGLRRGLLSHLVRRLHRYPLRHLILLRQPHSRPRQYRRSTLLPQLLHQHRRPA